MVAWNFLGGLVSGGKDLEALQGLILKFGEYSKILRTSVKTFVDWLANKSPSWVGCHAFIYGLLHLTNSLEFVRSTEDKLGYAFLIIAR